MKKTITILLLCCLCLNLTGYYIIFQFRKAAVKSAMKRMMRRQVNCEDALVFHFLPNAPPGTESPEWDDEEEFSLGGKMYDVIDKKMVDGQLVVRCISDEKETDLIHKYEEILEKSFSNQGKKHSASLLKLITTPFTIPTTLKTFAVKLLLQQEFPVVYCGIHTTCRDVITPPPRFL